jgi:predicted TIM-barrel fold metal-dependent hydrolase
MIDAHVILSGSADALLERMDRAGVGRAVLAGAHEDTLLCRSGLSPAGNRAVLEAIQAHTDRFVGCAYVNPMEDGAADQADKWADAGFRALKFFPADGYSPDDRLLWPVLERMQERRLAAVFHMGLADYAFYSAPGARRAPNSAHAYPMRLDPVGRLFPGVNFLVLNMGYPLMLEAWSVHHNSGNIFLHLGGEGVPFTALATAYVSLGGPGFIPLDFSRVVFGSCDAQDLPRAAALAADAVARMGCAQGNAGAVFGANVETLYRL